MNSSQRAVVAAARKDGLEPMEVAAELMNHDITEVVLGFMRKREVAFNKLGEKEQDSVIAELGAELKKITATACRVINANGVETVAATLKSLKIDGKLTATMVIDGDEPNRHVLTDKAHDKSSILIVLYPNSYSEGMSAHQGEKDQKPLPLDDAPSGAKAKDKSAQKAESPTSAKSVAAKPIEIPPKLLADAIEFIQKNQVCATSGLQNHLKIATKKAEAVQLKLAELGHIALDEQGVYQIVRDKAATGGSDSGAGLSFDGEDDSGAGDEPKTLTDDLYGQIKTKVIKDGRVSVGALAVAFDLDADLVDEAVKRLQDDAVISEEDEETGGREVLQLA
jgi:hypothetical protein